MAELKIKNTVAADINTPSIGSTSLYVDSTTKLLVSKDDSGTETAYGTGGGGGVDIPTLAEDTTPDNAADYALIYDDSATTNKKVLLSNLLPFVQTTAYVSDQRTSGTDGGATIVGWNDRQLNTLTGDTSFISLNANQITLAAGTYEIRGRGALHSAFNSRNALYDVTNSAIAMISNSGYSGTIVLPEFDDVLVVGASTTYKMQAYVAGAHASKGLGFATGIAGVNELFATLKITRISL